MSAQPASPGFYGKMHIRADFVSRRLPASFVSPWDEWLQEAMSASRSELGDQWLNIYLTSPIWRFALSAGTCGNRGCAGILMPSVDNVGRYFPLTLAVLLDQETLLPGLFLSGARWFEELERIALSSLDDYFNFERFDRQLQELEFEAILPHEDFHFEAEQIQGDSRRPFFRTAVSELAQIRDAFVDLSARLLHRTLPAFSFWCTTGSERVKPSLSVYAGLPHSSVFAKFLAGEPGHLWIKGPIFPMLEAKEEERSTRGNIDNQFDTTTRIERRLDATTRIERQLAGATRIQRLDATAKTVRTRWRSHACSNAGNIRTVNEDAFLERPEIGLWVVADGMGGHRGGRAASQAVVDSLNNIPETDSGIEELAKQVSRRLEKVNTDLFKMGRKFGEGVIVGSTVVALLVDNRLCVALWAGDSRLYRYRDGDLEQLTWDHSLISELSPQRPDSNEESEVDGFDSIITRALGAEREVEIDKIAREVREKDVFLLCSDGLVREMGDIEIADILSKTDIEQSAHALVNAALARGAKDNVTVVVVHAGKWGP